MGFVPGKFLVRHFRRGEVKEEVFVLIPGRDPAAVVALRAYARATPDAALAAYLTGWADRFDPPVEHGDFGELRTRIALWTAVLSDKVRAGEMELETALQRIAGHAMEAVRKR